MDPFTALLIALTSASTTPAVPSSEPTASTQSAPTPPPARRNLITTESVRLSLNTMLRDEGLSEVRTAIPSIRRVDLDGDASTEEALVDVVAPELCDAAGQCQTLVVRALPCGRLIALGHARWLQTLDSRAAGWTDLGETRTSFLFPAVVIRALRFRNGRYV